jgi:hypothetical protein
MSEHSESIATRTPGWVRRVAALFHAFVADKGAGKRQDEQVKPDDPIDQAGRDSFPASDPPAWTLGVESRERRQ